MDHLRRSGSSRRTQPAGKQPPPVLTRCNSEHPVTSPPHTTLSSNKSKTSKLRSISTGRTRNFKELVEVNIPTPITINTSVTNPSAKKKPTQDAGTKVLSRRKATSPSAWALSPGRVAPCPSPLPIKPPSPGGRTTGGGIGGVLKYFRQKKTASSEDAYLQSFKSVNNRLLQWRFANARAENTMSAVKAVAEGDVLAVCDELERAVTLLSDIESTITTLAYEAEKSCYLLTELSIIAKQEHESLTELQKWMTGVALLKEEERSLQAHQLQAK